MFSPDLRRMAKSPTSCGISWMRMAKVVSRPMRVLARKLPPIARPCVKLSTLLANRFRYPAACERTQMGRKLT